MFLHSYLGLIFLATNDQLIANLTVQVLVLLLNGINNFSLILPGIIPEMNSIIPVVLSIIFQIFICLLTYEYVSYISLLGIQSILSY